MLSTRVELIPLFIYAALWGAAYVIGGGCSDDEFLNFLAWLISRGRHWHERALLNPDDLADYPENLSTTTQDSEDFAHLASEIYLGKFGYIPNMDRFEANDDPSRDRWNEDMEVFRSRWPRLFRKYWKE